MGNSSRWRLAGMVSALVVSACGGGGGGGITIAAVPDTTAQTPNTPGTPTGSNATGSNATGSGSTNGATPTGSGNVSPVPAPTPAPSSAPAPAPAPIGAAHVVAITNSSASGVAVLGKAVRVAAWSDTSGVHAQQFDVSGALVQGSVPVAASGTFAAVAALPGGGYVVEYRTTQAVFVQVVGAGGALVGPAAVVRTQDQVAQDYASVPSANPVLVGGGGVYAFADGSFAASYIVQHTVTIPTDTPTALLAQKFDASGQPVGSPVLLRDTITVDEMASAAAPGDRLIAASMLTHSSGAGLQGAQVFDSGLNRLFGASLGLLGDNDIQPSVAGLANGNFIAVWTVSAQSASPDANQVQAQIFTADPSSPSGARVVPGLLTFPNAAPGARVTALASGGFLVTWGSSAQAFDDNGQAVSAVMQIQPGSVAATADGGFVVLSQVGSQLVEQQYEVAP